MASPTIGGTPRYNVAGGELDNRTTQSGTQSQVGSQTGSTTGSQSQTGNSSSTTTTNQTTKNLSPELEAELNNLVKELAAGGTPQMQADRARRIQVINNTLAQQAQYSKAAAFGDAQGLISQQMRRSLESLLPSINKPAEDAGSSGGALRALLLQDAANKAAESSSALGVQTAVQYGGISGNMAQVLEALTRPDATQVNALIGAINTGKGANVTTTGTQTTVGQQSQTSNSQQNTNANTTQNTTSNENKLVDYAPFQVTNTTPQFFGDTSSMVDPSKYVGSTIDNMRQLAGVGSPWSSYTF